MCSRIYRSFLQLAFAPADVSLNSQALRLWEYFHNRKNWLFAGSERAGKRAAAIQSCKTQRHQAIRLA
jgi:hypothetical protein